MTGIYYPELLDVLRAGGCAVSENATTNGWQNRARSSGGFPSPPLCVFVHHTASSTSVANDLSYMIDGCDDAPVGNILLDRDGICWPIAAGASNCAGKGGPSTFSRGTCPVDQGNTRGFQIECANGGTGENWPVAQVNALFNACNALNAHVGNSPMDVITHALGAGDGYTPRKIDPATASAVSGAWIPRSTNSSGTWSLADIRNECAARAGHAPGPVPPPNGDDDDMKAQIIKGDGSDTYWAWDGVNISGVPSLEWAEWGFEAGLYQSASPTVYPQGFVDSLVDTQGER